MSSQPIRLGFIGLSKTGSSWAERAHLPSLRDNTGYEITALLNSSKESAEASARHNKLSNAACYGNIEDLVRDPNVDVIAVSIKVPDHLKMIEPALESGKGLFVEWPLARTVADAEMMTARAKASNLKTMVGLQARLNPSILKAKAMIEGGELGDILSTTMIGKAPIFGAMLPDKYDYLCQLENGANLVTIPMGHAIDAFCFVVGELSDLQATLAVKRPTVGLIDANGNYVRDIEKNAHDHVAVTGHLQNGGGVASVLFRGGLSKTGKNFCWEINGTKGTLIMESDNAFVGMSHLTVSFVKEAEGATLEVIEVEKVTDPSFNVRRGWEAFLNGEMSKVATFEEALVRHRMIDAIYRSDEKGTRESYV